MAQLIAKRYATALFEIAKEQRAMDEFESEVKGMKEILEQEKDFFTVLSHPSISQTEKINLVEKVFKGNIKEELVGLLVIIVKKGRQEHILEILSTFLEMAKDFKGIIEVEVTSVVALKDEQLAQIKANVEKNTNKQVVLQTTIDQSLIGGMIVRVGDRVVDGSIRGQMDSLKSQLHNLRLA